MVQAGSGCSDEARPSMAAGRGARAGTGLPGRGGTAATSVTAGSNGVRGVCVCTGNHGTARRRGHKKARRAQDSAHVGAWEVGGGSRVRSGGKDGGEIKLERHRSLSMGEAALHFITSIEKDGNSSSTLSFSKFLYIYTFNHRYNLCIYLSTYYMASRRTTYFCFCFQ